MLALVQDFEPVLQHVQVPRLLEPEVSRLLEVPRLLEPEAPRLLEPEQTWEPLGLAQVLSIRKLDIHAMHTRTCGPQSLSLRVGQHARKKEARAHRYVTEE